jgi:hypothetical protein
MNPDEGMKTEQQLRCDPGEFQSVCSQELQGFYIRNFGRTL